MYRLIENAWRDGGRFGQVSVLSVACCGRELVSSERGTEHVAEDHQGALVRSSTVLGHRPPCCPLSAVYHHYTRLYA